MFTDAEREELVMRVALTLEQQKAGFADARRGIAEKIVDEMREYLKARYNAGNNPQINKTGIWQTKNSLTKEDFGR